MLRELYPNEVHGFWCPKHPHNLQVAIQVKDKKNTAKLLKNFKTAFIGLRTRCDGKAIYKREGPVPLFKLPDTIQNAKDACNFVRKHICLPYNDALATLAFNDDIVVVNTHHVFSDGGFATEFNNHCLDDSLGPEAEVSIPSEVVYKEQIEIMKENMPKDIYSNSQITTLTCKPKDEPECQESNILTYEIPVSKFQCYSAEKKRPIKLTESIWAASSLAMCTIENNFSKFGINTCFNMRKYLKDSRPNWAYADHYAVPNIVARKHSMDMSIAELGNEFREHYNYLNKNYGLIYSYNFPYERTFPKSVYFNVSNIGPLKLDDRVKDIYIQGNTEGPGMESFIYYCSFSKVTKDSNTYSSKLRFPREAVSRRTAQLLNESIYHLLVDVPPNTTLKEAVKELRDYMRKYDGVF